jgi:hypothetical protein
MTLKVGDDGIDLIEKNKAIHTSSFANGHDAYENDLQLVFLIRLLCCRIHEPSVM